MTMMMMMIIIIVLLTKQAKEIFKPTNALITMEFLLRISETVRA